MFRGTVLVVWLAVSAGCRPSVGARPPGDEVFADGFESGTLAAWQDGVDPARQRVVRAPGVAHSGAYYLDVTYPAGRDGGWLTRFFLPGYDSIYVGLWVRFPPGWAGTTKLVALYGSRTDDRWSAMGRAGRCPDGTDFFSTALVTDPPGAPGSVRFYTYYPGMPRQPDGVTCYGAFGDGLAAYAPLALSPGTWHHLELWVRLNTPGAANGAETYWQDGVRRGTWSGLEFRDSDVLRLDAVMLSFSVGAAPRTEQLGVDDVVVRRTPPDPEP